MYSVSFFVPGIPAAKPRPRQGKYGIYSPRPKKLKAWEAAIYAEMIEHKPDEPLTGPVRVGLVFVFQRPLAHYVGGKRDNKLKDDAPYWHIIKPDRDNIDKPILDVGSCPENAKGKRGKKGGTPKACIWVNDSQVCSGGPEKIYTTLNRPEPGCWVVIEELLP